MNNQSFFQEVSPDNTNDFFKFDLKFKRVNKNDKFVYLAYQYAGEDSEVDSLIKKDCLQYWSASKLY